MRSSTRENSDDKSIHANEDQKLLFSRVFQLILINITIARTNFPGHNNRFHRRFIVPNYTDKRRNEGKKD